MLLSFYTKFRTLCMSEIWKWSLFPIVRKIITAKRSWSVDWFAEQVSNSGCYSNHFDGYCFPWDTPIFFTDDDQVCFKILTTDYSWIKNERRIIMNQYEKIKNSFEKKTGTNFTNLNKNPYFRWNSDQRSRLFLSFFVSKNLLYKNSRKKMMIGQMESYQIKSDFL